VVNCVTNRLLEYNHSGCVAYLDKAWTLEPNQNMEHGAANARVCCAVEQEAELLIGP
jgi:hypothetical protein